MDTTDTILVTQLELLKKLNKKYMQTGIFISGRVYTKPKNLSILSEEHEIGFILNNLLKSYEISNPNDWWPSSGQEVKFILIDDKAFIKGVGDRNKLNSLLSYSI